MPSAIRPIRLRDARAARARAAREPRVAAPVGGDEPRRPGALRHAGRRPPPAAAVRAHGQRRAVRHGGRGRARRAAERVWHRPRSLASATIGYWVARALRRARNVTPTAVALATDHCFDGARPAPHGDLHPARERGESCAWSRSSASATRDCAAGTSTSTATGATTTASRSWPRRCPRACCGAGARGRAAGCRDRARGRPGAGAHAVPLNRALRVATSAASAAGKRHGSRRERGERPAGAGTCHGSRGTRTGGSPLRCVAERDTP